MNEFQLGLKLQVSGAEAVQTALGEVTKKLGDQLTGIQEFTTKLGEGNESVRGYIQSAKNLIEQNPIQETLGKLSGLAQAIGLEKVSDGIKSTAGSLKSWTGEITGFLGQTEKASRLIKGVLEGDVSGAIGKVKQNLASMSTVGGIAKALGLESVVTSAQQTRDSVEAMTGKLREFGSGAGSAGEIVKRVLLTDTNGAIGVVRTGLQSMGNFADLATRMGLHGVAGEIDSIAKKAGEWTGKIEEFSTRSTQAGEKLNTSFGGTLPPAMSKAAGALLELTGTSDKLLPFLDGMQQQFQALTGKSFPEAFKGMQGLSKEFGNGGSMAGKLSEALKLPGGPANLLAGGLGIVGAAIAGWQIGKAIGDMDLFGVKINDVAQYSIAKVMQGFEKFKRWLHITTEEEYQRNSKAYGDTANQIAVNQPEQKRGGAAAANPAAAATTPEIQLLEQVNKLKLDLERKNQEDLEALRKEFEEKTAAELQKKTEEEEKEKAAAVKAAEEKAKREIELLKEKIAANDKIITQLKEQKKLQTDDEGKGAGIATVANTTATVGGPAKKGGLKKAPGGAETPDKAEAKKADPKSYADQFGKVLDDLQNKAGTMAQQVAGAFQNTIGAAVDSIASGITGLINGTMTWSQALQNIGSSIVNSIIGSFAKMAAQWIVNQILMWTVGKALQAASMASSTAAAAATTATWSGPATLVTIGTLGTMAGIAPGLILAASGMTAGLMGGSSAASSVGSVAGAAAEGGLITGPGTGTSDSIPMRLSNGEYVIPAARVAEFGAGFFDGIRTGSISARALTPSVIQRGEFPAMNLRGMTPNVNVQSAQPKVIVVNSQEELMKVMKGSIGEEITVAHIAKNKLRLGMAS